jgi:hypothetical protein
MTKKIKLSEQVLCFEVDQARALMSDAALWALSEDLADLEDAIETAAREAFREWREKRPGLRRVVTLRVS